MPSVKLSPLFNDAQFDDNGDLLAGGKVYWYLAGTTTPATTYSDSGGTTANTNPVILNVRGEPSLPVWLATGSAYKAILTDSLDNTIRQFDNISGINDTSTPVISEWVLFAGAATYINATQFSVTGDQRSTFTDTRRVKANCSGTDLYGTINGTPVFAAGVTTVTVTLDSGVFDASLATVYYGFLDPAHPSFDTSTSTNTKAGIQKQTWTAFTTGGVSGTFTLTPVPAITVYTANVRFNVTFSAAGNGSDTLNVSGLGAKNLKQYDQQGNKVAPVIKLNQVADVVYDGTDFVILNPEPQVSYTNQANKLVISATGKNANITVTADYLTIRNSAGQVLSASSVSLTINTAGSGANGLDTGTLAANTWYAIHILGKQDGTICGVISANETSPTMPSGYTYGGLFGYAKTDNTANKYPLALKQTDKTAQYIVDSTSNLTALPIMASGSSVGNILTPTWVSFAITGFIPTFSGSVSSRVSHLLGVITNPSTGVTIVAPNNSYGGYTSTTNPPPTQAWANGVNQFRFMIESNNFYWANNSGGTALICCMGWEVNA